MIQRSLGQRVTLRAAAPRQAQRCRATHCSMARSIAVLPRPLDMPLRLGQRAADPAASPQPDSWPAIPVATIESEPLPNLAFTRRGTSPLTLAEARTVVDVTSATSRLLQLDEIWTAAATGGQSSAELADWRGWVDRSMTRTARPSASTRAGSASPTSSGTPEASVTRRIC